MLRKSFLLILLLSFISLTGFGCKLTSQTVQDKMKPITLNVWGVFDNDSDLQPLLAKFTAQHPYVTIKYRKLLYSEYEQALLEAWADDQGPDVFFINSAWTDKYLSKIEPAPTSISLVFPVTQGTINPETIPQLQAIDTLNPGKVRSLFVDAVAADGLRTMTDPATKQTIERVVALPLSMDTMVMYYNKDLLNNANIADLSPYWNRQFQQDVKKLTKQNTQGDIIQAGAALGGGTNIERSADLLSVLMMQNGAKIIDGQDVLFNQVSSASDNNGRNPGLEALRFYTDFANPAKEVYTWNSALDNSLEMFVTGKLAIMFGYAYHLPEIQARAPQLNLGIKPLPQIEGSDRQANIANYWLATVAHKSQNINEAWGLVQFLATDTADLPAYLKNANRPAALRSLLKAQLDDPQIGPFAGQVLTASTWYHGADPLAGDQTLVDLIERVVKDPDKLDTEAGLAASRLAQTVKGK